MGVGGRGEKCTFEYALGEIDQRKSTAFQPNDGPRLAFSEEGRDFRLKLKASRASWCQVCV